MSFNILSKELLFEFTQALGESPLEQMRRINKEEISVEYFNLYKSLSSVYSSKIEGENIDFDSYYKHQFLNVPYQVDYTKRTDDLFASYTFIESHEISFENLQKAHAILIDNLLPKSQQGLIHNNRTFVINKEDKFDYIPANPAISKRELDKLLEDIEVLKNSKLNAFENFYYAAYIHLAFAIIYPFLDGNERTARLLEKWFFIENIGNEAAVFKLEKNYFIQLNDYYNNLRILGLEYDHLDYSKNLNFILVPDKGISTVQ